MELSFPIASNPRAFPPLCGAILTFAFALFLLLKSGLERVRTWFAVAAICTSVWSMTVVLASSFVETNGARSAGQVAFAAIALTSASSLVFALAIARVRSRVPQSIALFGVAAAVLVLVIPGWTQVRPHPTGGYWPAPCVAAWIALAVSIPAVGLAVAVLGRAWGAAPPSRRRRQLGWALSAYAISALAMFDVRTLFAPAYPIGWATSTLAAATLFYAILQHRLLAMRSVVRQILVSLVGIALALGIGAAVAIERSGSFASLPFVKRAALVGATVVLVRLWIASVRPALHRLLGWRSRRMERAWNQFQRRSLEARSPGDFARHFREALAAALDVKVVRDFGLPSESIDPVIVGARGALSRLSHPVLRDLVDLDDHDDAASLLAVLDDLGADALLPLVHRGELQAVWAIRGESLTQADDALADALLSLCERAAVAFVNARLYDEVRRRSEGFERDVRLRTAELEDALSDLERAQAGIIEADRSAMLGLLVAGISHEINNALNFISANLPTLERYAERLTAFFADAAKQDPSLDAAHVATSSLVRAAEALREATGFTSRIVLDLRKFARPDTERRLVAVEEGIEAALNLLRRRSDGRIDVVRAYEGMLRVEGHPGPLHQCFFNLLLRAIVAAKEGISILMRGTAEPGVEVIISDDGAPVYSGASRPRWDVGIMVSRVIIERHGGVLSFSSGLEGNRVRIRLPALPPSAVK